MLVVGYSTLLSIFAVLLTLVGCKEYFGVQTRIEVPAQNSSSSQNAIANNPSTNDDDPVDQSEDDGLFSDEDDDNQDDDDDEDDEADDDEDAEIDYPKLSYQGKGYTTYELNDHLQMTMTIETEIDDEVLQLDQTAARVLCGDMDGCEQGDVDTEVNQNSVGSNRYDRLDAEKRRELEKDGFQYVGYTIFATGVTSLRGIRFTFDEPLPVYPWPAPRARYDEATASGETWTSRVTADRNIDNDGANIRTFTATVTVKKLAQSGDTTQLELSLSIPEDRDGFLYKVFPLPKKASYTINTDERDIREIDQLGWTHGSESERREETQLLFKLCSKEVRGKTERFSCD